MEDIQACIEVCNTDEPEVCLVRSRNGSKTHDMIVFALYMAYLGYDVMFYVAEGTQMEQPQKYLNDLVMGFVFPMLVDNKRKRTKEFRYGGSITISLLSENKARSPRADIIIYDEEGLMEEVAYKATFGIIKGSKIGLKIHSSTPVRGSVFHKNVDRVQVVLKHPYNEIGFLNKKLFELDKQIMPDFEFKREYECSFENPGGSVFTKVVYKDIPELQLVNFKCSGLDFNPAEHHYLIAGQWTTDYHGFLITDVVDVSEGFKDSLDDGMFVRIHPFMTRGNKLTAEDGGANLGFAAWLRDKVNKNRNLVQTHNVSYEQWDEKSKFEQVVKLMNTVIYVDMNKFPELAKEIEQATWDDKSPTPKLHKSPAKSPHRLDGLIHATSDKNWAPLHFSSFKV